jgi:hypothetical protein
VNGGASVEENKHSETDLGVESKKWKSVNGCREESGAELRVVDGFVICAILNKIHYTI